MQRHESETRSAIGRGVCAVLTPSGAGATGDRSGSENTANGSLSDDLLAALRSRGMRVELCRDAYHAMGVLVRREHSRPEGELTVLLFIDADRVDRVTELHSCAGVHAPHAALWSFDPATRRLGAYQPSLPRASEDKAPPVEVRSRSYGRSPALRLAGEGAPGGSVLNEREERAGTSTPSTDLPSQQNRAQTGGVEKVGAAPSSAGATLTDEELAMLLADDR